MILWIEHLPVLAWGPDFWIPITHIKARQALWHLHSQYSGGRGRATQGKLDLVGDSKKNREGY